MRQFNRFAVWLAGLVEAFSNWVARWTGLCKIDQAITRRKCQQMEGLAAELSAAGFGEQASRLRAVAAARWARAFPA